jgi:hypothetical protein
VAGHGGGPAVAPGSGFRGPCDVLPCRWDGCRWLAGCECLEAGDRGGDLLGPGPGAGEPETDAAAAADDPPGAGEDPQAQPSGFPAAGFAGEGEHLGSGEQLAGQGDDLAPDLVLVISVQGKVAQAGVLGAADPVLAPGPAAVA